KKNIADGAYSSTIQSSAVITGRLTNVSGSLASWRLALSASVWPEMILTLMSNGIMCLCSGNAGSTGNRGDGSSLLERRAPQQRRAVGACQRERADGLRDVGPGEREVDELGRRAQQEEHGEAAREDEAVVLAVAELAGGVERQAAQHQLVEQEIGVEQVQE